MKTLLPKAKWYEIVLCVSFVNIPAAAKAFKDTRLSVGAQNLQYAPEGAYPGEVSASMLKDAGTKYVIVGHSERRAQFGETDLIVNKKARAAVDAGLYPIICVGETEEQRELGLTAELVSLQVRAALAGFSADKLCRAVIAYEPVWATGTGNPATSAQAGEICNEIRATIRHLYGARIARSVTILYGGSMNPENAYELLSQPDIDGGLVGNASLSASDFTAIINAANQE
jgi:triosephosphate isomerase